MDLLRIIFHRSYNLYNTIRISYEPSNFSYYNVYKLKEYIVLT